MFQKILKVKDILAKNKLPRKILRSLYYSGRIQNFLKIQHKHLSSVGKYMAFLHKYLPILALKHVLQMIKEVDSRKLRTFGSMSKLRMFNVLCAVCWA